MNHFKLSPDCCSVHTCTHTHGRRFCSLLEHFRGCCFVGELLGNTFALLPVTRRAESVLILQQPDFHTPRVFKAAPEHYLVISRQLGEVGKSHHHYPHFTERGETKTGVIYALPKATQHVDGRVGISAKELLARSPGSGLCPLAPASPGVEIHLCVSERGEKGRGGQDVQEIRTVMSSSGVLFVPKGWAQRA